MFKRNLVLCTTAVLLGGAMAVPGRAAADAAAVTVTVQADKVVQKIDNRIYSQFLEHINHSVDGGLWGEMIGYRGFEGWTNRRQWSVADNLLSTLGEGGMPVFLGEPAWTDYEYSFEARKIKGPDGFMAIVRAGGDKPSACFFFGGAKNTRYTADRWVDDKYLGGFAPPVKGALTDGQWYPVRIRCAGAHVQAWLGDQKVFDVPAAESVSATGCVGVRAMGARCEFRNFKVATLTGQPLLAGMPEERAIAVCPRGWRPFGRGVAEAVAQPKSIDGGMCLLLRGAAGGETGVEQKPFYLKAGATYHGSVWLKGDMPVTLRLKQAATLAAEMVFPAGGAEWTERPFTIKPSVTVDNATLQVSVAAGNGTAWVDQLSLMAEESRAVGGFRPDLLKAIADLKPATIRWPGGCYASGYRWKECVGPQHARVTNATWGDIDCNGMGTDEFMELCRRTGAAPIFVINTNLPVEYTLDWMEYCNGAAGTTWGAQRARNGHPEPYNVIYWEIDNEAWGMGAQRYNEIVQRFVPPMRKAWPQIKVSVCGGYGYDTDPGRGGWDQKMMDGTGKLWDYLSVHYYEGLGPSNPANAGKYGLHLLDVDQRLRASANPNARVYCSEWGLDSSWRAGLYAGGILNSFERVGDMMACPALFLRATKSTSWDNALVNFDHYRWYPAPHYVVMKLWHDHFAPDLLALDGATAPLDLNATRSADGKKVFLKVVNCDKKAEFAVVVNVAGGFKPAGATMQLVACADERGRNTLEDPEKIRANPAPVQWDGKAARFVMPPLSAGVVTIE